MINKIRIFFLTLTEQQKRKYIKIFFSIIFIVVIAILLSIFVPEKTNTSIIKTLTGNTILENKIPEKITWTADNSKGFVSYIDELEIKTTSNLKIEENLIKILEKEDINKVLNYLFTKQYYNLWEVKKINEFLSWKDIEEKLLLPTCVFEKCTLNEKIKIFNWALKIKEYLSKEKKKNETIINELLKYNSLSKITKKLSVKNNCSEKNIIKKYINKLKYSKNKLDINKNIKSFLTLNTKTNHFNHKTIINELYINSKKYKLSLLNIKKIKKGKIHEKKVSFWNHTKTIKYYNYKDVYFEKFEIDKLSNYLSNDFFKITKNKKYSYLFENIYIETKKGEIKIWTPRLLLLDNKTINETIIYLYLASIKDNCNFSKISFSKYKEDIGKDILLKKIISKYEKLQLKMRQGSLEIQELEYIKHLDLVLDVIFINNK